MVYQFPFEINYTMKILKFFFTYTYILSYLSYMVAMLIKLLACDHWVSDQYYLLSFNLKNFYKCKFCLRWYETPCHNNKVEKILISIGST